MSLPLALDARDVKSRADFFAIASGYMRLRRAGRQFVGLCPFHSERHPSCYVHPEKKTFYCFGCGAGGDLFDFVMRAEGCDFPRVLQIVADFFGVVSRTRLHSENRNRCCVCGRVGQDHALDVHHVLKRRAFPRVRNARGSMVVCCRACHSLLERLFPVEALYAIRESKHAPDPQGWLRRFVLWRVKYGGREKVPFLYGRLDFSPEAPKGPEGLPGPAKSAKQGISHHSPESHRAIEAVNRAASAELATACELERSSFTCQEPDNSPRKYAKRARNGACL